MNTIPEFPVKEMKRLMEYFPSINSKELTNFISSLEAVVEMGKKNLPISTITKTHTVEIEGKKEEGKLISFEYECKDQIRLFYHPVKEDLFITFLNDGQTFEWRVFMTGVMAAINRDERISKIINLDAILLFIRDFEDMCRKKLSSKSNDVVDNGKTFSCKEITSSIFQKNHELALANFLASFEKIATFKEDEAMKKVELTETKGSVSIDGKDVPSSFFELKGIENSITLARIDKNPALVLIAKTGEFIYFGALLIKMLRSTDVKEELDHIVDCMKLLASIEEIVM